MGAFTPWKLTNATNQSSFSPLQRTQFSSVSQSCPTLCDPHGLQHARLPCPSSTPRACSNSCSLSWWGHSTTSSSVVPLSSCLQYFPALGSFPISQFLQRTGLPETTVTYFQIWNPIMFSHSCELCLLSFTLFLACLLSLIHSTSSWWPLFIHQAQCRELWTKWWRKQGPVLTESSGEHRP